MQADTVIELREQYHARRINESLQQTAESIIETGRRLAQARAEIPHGQWQAFVKTHLSISVNVTGRLMKIAEVMGPRIAKSAHGQIMPTTWRTLEELARLDNADFELIRPNIKPDMARSEVQLMRNALRFTGKPMLVDLSDKPLPEREPADCRGWLGCLRQLPFRRHVAHRTTRARSSGPSTACGSSFRRNFWAGWMTMTSIV